MYLAIKQRTLILIFGPFFYLKQNWKTAAGLLLLFIALTVVTQVGGVILWGSLPLLDFIRYRAKYVPLVQCSLTFVMIYLIVIIAVLPFVAPTFGRVPLPWFATENISLRPVNILYCVFARNYVHPTLKVLLEKVAINMAEDYKHAAVIYLDANFPFINGFPLLPHLSHHDGKKVDLAFFYRDAKSKESLRHPPSPIGYWAYEQPYSNEIRPCRNTQGWLRWDFDGLQPFFAFAELDSERTRAMLVLLAESKHVQKILIEPHLKTRLRLSSDKVRFQGCHAARHDDHVHIQIW